MIKFLIDIYYVWKNELKIVFRDPAVLLIFIIVPLAYPLIYSFIYNNEVARNIPVVVVDDSNTSLSRKFYRMVDATAAIQLMGYESNMDEAKERLYKREVNGIIYIPQDFSRNIGRGMASEVLLFCDMNNLLYYSAMATNTSVVSQLIGASVRAKTIGGTTIEDNMLAMQPVSNTGVNLFNPAGGFASAIIPGVLVLIIQQTLILGIATILGTHKDKKRFTLASHVAEGRYVNALRLNAGKAFAYGSSYVVLICWVLGVIPYIFWFPQVGNPYMLLAFLLPYILASTFFAMTLSYFCSQREFAMLLFVFTSPIFLFLSGISWPLSNVPPVLKAIAYLIPSTHGIHGFTQINTMGATLNDVLPSYIALWIQSGVYLITSTLMYKWWIKNYDPEFKGKLRM